MAGHGKGLGMIQDRFRDIAAVDGSLIYGPPHETADGTTVITVTGTGGFFRPRPRPLGVFVVHGGEVTWEPATDKQLVALLGVLTGLIAAAFATGAMLRRPPWPDIRITSTC